MLTRRMWLPLMGPMNKGSIVVARCSRSEAILIVQSPRYKLSVFLLLYHYQYTLPVSSYTNR